MKIPLHRRQRLPPERHLSRRCHRQRNLRQAITSTARIPVGKSFEKGLRQHRFRIVGVVRDARYRSMREPILPVAYVPFRVDRRQGRAAADLRSDVHRAHVRPEPARAGIHPAPGSAARAPGIPRQQHPHADGDQSSAQTVRERLLAMLALFFAVVALLARRRRPLRRARLLRAAAAPRNRHSHGDRRTSRAISRAASPSDVFSMVLAGALAGLALGMASVRYIESLLYQVKATDLGDARAAVAHHSCGGVAGRAAGRDPRGANRPGRHAARRLAVCGKRQVHFG